MTKALRLVSRLLENEQLEMFTPEELGPRDELHGIDPEAVASDVSMLSPRITATFARYTPASIEAGDAEETGLEDEDGESMEPDPWDIEEGLTSVDLAVNWLINKEASEPSSSHFHPGTWYTSRHHDYHTGEEMEYNYHLEDFTEEEERQIFQRITGSKR